MKDSSGLVLGVAGRGESWKLGEEDRAVGDVAGRGDGISQNVGRAAAVLVVTVGSRSSSGAGAVTGNCCQASRDSVLGGSGGRLEVRAELGTSTGRGGSRSGKSVTVGKSGADGGELGASAAGANRSTLRQVKSLGNPSSLSTINGDGKLFRVERESTSQFSGVLLCVRNQTTGENLEVTTIVERMKSSSLNSDFLSLSGLEGDKVLSSQASGQETKLDAFKRNLGGYTTVSSRSLLEQ